MYKNQNYQTGEKNIPYLFFDDDIIKNYHEWVNNALNTIKMKNEVFDGENAYEINIPVKGFKKEQLFLAIDEETMFLIVDKQANFKKRFKSFHQVKKDYPEAFTKSFHVYSKLINAEEISAYYIHKLETLKVILPKLDKEVYSRKITSVLPIY